MKIQILFAAIGLALALPLPALAAESHQQDGSGHYEWRPLPQFGPRTTGPAQKRVWVSDKEEQQANCECAMMKMSANACMMPMHHRGGSAS